MTRWLVLGIVISVGYVIFVWAHGTHAGGNSEANEPEPRDARQILADIVQQDPWERDSELGWSYCHFCGSPEMVAPHTNMVQFLHWRTCLWMEALALLGVLSFDHHYYEPPPNKPPCPTCGFQANEDASQPGVFYGPDSIATLDTHHLHLAREAGFDTIDEWINDTNRKAWTSFFTHVANTKPYMITEWGYDLPPKEES